jgi:protein phosphatase
MMEAFGLTDPGCIRKNNEDCFLIDQAAGLYLLADGMGGQQAGELASQLAVETVADIVRKADQRSPQLLTSAFEEANRRVLARAATEACLNGMGTTLIGVLDLGEQMVICSVGDSRVYLFEEGELSAITEDQTWANEVGRRLGLDDERLKTYPMRHVLTMAIGVETPLRIHSYLVRPAPGILLLLCSDGLHGVVDPKNITDGLKKSATLETKCHYLVEAARRAGGPDNITTVLLLWNNK